MNGMLEQFRRNNLQGTLKFPQTGVVFSPEYVLRFIIYLFPMSH